MDGPDTRYGQLYKHISATAFDEAGITYDEACVHGFTPSVHIGHRTSVLWLIFLFLREAFVGLRYWISTTDSMMSYGDLIQMLNDGEWRN